jgi:multisubunit Na+/H+ antiporter MnhC subunit
MQVSKTTPLLVWADVRLRHQGSNRHLTSCVRRELPFPSFTQTSTSAPLPFQLILSSIVILYCFIASFLDKSLPSHQILQYVHCTIRVW